MMEKKRMRLSLPFKHWVRFHVFGKCVVVPLVFVFFAFPEALSSIWKPLPSTGMGLMIAML